MLNSSQHFKYRDVKSIFDRKMVWFDRFFVLSKKNTLFEAEHLCFKVYQFDSINKRMDSGQTGWPMVKALDWSSNTVCVRGFESHLCRLVVKSK